MTLTAEFIKGAAAHVVGRIAGAAAESALKKASAKKPKRSRRTEDRIARALADLRRSGQQDPALADFREDLFGRAPQTHQTRHRAGQEGQARSPPHSHSLLPLTSASLLRLTLDPLERFWVAHPCGLCKGGDFLTASLLFLCALCASLSPCTPCSSLLFFHLRCQNHSNGVPFNKLFDKLTFPCYHGS
jgi:hypothetical protein